MMQLNERQPLRRLGVTRRRLLEEVDRPALKALPDGAYEYSEWRGCRVGIDYHIDIDAHYYSVPYRFARAEVDARLTARGVEIFHKGERIAIHLRSSGNRKHTTVSEHMPSSHLGSISLDLCTTCGVSARRLRLARRLGCTVGCAPFSREPSVGPTTIFAECRLVAQS